LRECRPEGREHTAAREGDPEGKTALTVKRAVDDAGPGGRQYAGGGAAIKIPSGTANVADWNCCRLQPNSRVMGPAKTLSTNGGMAAILNATPAQAASNT